jgi:hypothetical protein
MRGRVVNSRDLANYRWSFGGPKTCWRSVLGVFCVHHPLERLSSVISPPTLPNFPPTLPKFRQHCQTFPPTLPNFLTNITQGFHQHCQTHYAISHHHSLIPRGRPHLLHQVIRVLPDICHRIPVEVADCGATTSTPTLPNFPHPLQEFTPVNEKTHGI